MKQQLVLSRALQSDCELVGGHLAKLGDELRILYSL